ncbi:hypothetical protein CEW92_03875 [Bacillaceae bacterium SAS-127]|nr:hypothetical protein CEW92_03875 [Bacillaceae bacterium SAS-127]
MKGLLLDSKENRIPLRMYYMNVQGKVTEWIITVVSFTGDVIKAYCHWRKQYRTFRRSNILSVGPLRSRRGA